MLVRHLVRDQMLTWQQNADLAAIHADALNHVKAMYKQSVGK